MCTVYRAYARELKRKALEGAEAALRRARSNARKAELSALVEKLRVELAILS